jgi:hypothetical protein
MKKPIEYSPIDYVICRHKLQIQWHRALRDKDYRSLGSAMAYTIDEYLTHRNFWTRDVLVKEALVLLGCADKSIVYGMLDEDVRVLVESVLEILELGAAGRWDLYGAGDWRGNRHETSSDTTDTQSASGHPDTRR